MTNDDINERGQEMMNQLVPTVGIHKALAMVQAWEEDCRVFYGIPVEPKPRS